MDAAAEVARAPARPFVWGAGAAEWRDQRGAGRYFAPLADARQDGWPASWCPGGGEAGEKGVAGLVPEEDDASPAARPLLMRGHSRRSQAATSASSRSR